MRIIHSVNDVLEHGLRAVGCCIRDSEKQNILQFKKHYGPHPVVLTSQWADLCEFGYLSHDEKKEWGFLMFLLAHHFLWAYPKNAAILATTFPKISNRKSYGKHLWKWIKHIASLKDRKIVWDPRLDDPNAELVVLSVDGVDFRTWERKHHHYNIDTAAASHKFKHCAAKYEIVVSVWDSKVVHVAGPFPGGTHDLEMFRQSGLKEKLISTNKMAVADRGYVTQVLNEKPYFCVPDLFDSKALSKFKTRARLCHETLNGRLTKYSSLAQLFRHGFEEHKHVLEAVLVTTQYAMEHGSPLFET